jgi:acetyl esterase/lipase
MRSIFKTQATGMFLLLAAQAVGAAEPVGEEHVYKTVGDRELRLYVNKPDGWRAGDSRPAIVFFHGGGWVGGTPGQFTEHSKYLVTRGMVCVQVEYRLLERSGNEPPLTCVQDAKSAMRWVRVRAGELGIDPQRIASAGGSSGGHLASFVGMVEGLDDPHDDLSVSAKSNAMLLFNPVFDNGPGGFGHQRVRDRFHEFSPFHNVSEDDPPAIVFLGTEDKLVPVKTVEQFAENMQAAGVRCEKMFFEGQPHGFFNFGRSGNRYYLETMSAADEFLHSLGWLEGPPTLQRRGGETSR